MADASRIKGVPTLMMYRMDKWFGTIRELDVFDHSIVQEHFNKTINLLHHVFIVLLVINSNVFGNTYLRFYTPTCCHEKRLHCQVLGLIIIKHFLE
jgi:hypothetical protein